MFTLPLKRRLPRLREVALTMFTTSSAKVIVPRRSPRIGMQRSASSLLMLRLLALPPICTVVVPLVAVPQPRGVVGGVLGRFGGVGPGCACQNVIAREP